MVINLILVVFFIIISFVLWRQNQFNVLISAVSLLAVTLPTRPFSAMIETLLTRNGYAKDGYPILILYLLGVIVGWGLLYAVLSNLKLYSIEKYKKISVFVIAAVFCVAVGVIICFGVSNISVGSESNGSWFCRTCKVDQISLSNQDKIILSSEQLDEVIQLPSDLLLKAEDRSAEQKLLSKINEDRTSRLLKPLSSSDPLNNLSANYARTIISDLRFSHLDVNNNSPADRAGSLGIYYTFLGENLAIASDVSVAHSALMDSPTHRQNILSDKFDKIGLAVFSLRNGSIILVEEFLD